MARGKAPLKQGHKTQNSVSKVEEMNHTLEVPLMN